MNKKGTWDNISFVDNLKDLERYEGFLYCIEEIDTGMRYYGIKKFWRTVKKKPTKYKLNLDGSYAKNKKGKRILNTRTTKKHTRVESDWRDYTTSSFIMQMKLEKNRENYVCRIVCLCKTVTDMKANEAYLQLQHYVNGTWDTLYNECINLRLRIRK